MPSAIENERANRGAAVAPAALWLGDDLQPVSAEAARQSRVVGFLRLLLPAFAAALIVLVIAWPEIHRQVGMFTVRFSPIKISDLRVQMTGARFDGTSDSGKPYRITAAKAVQVSNDHDRIALTALRATFTMNNGTWTAIHADHGFYHRARKILDLAGRVSAFTDRGYEFHDTTATVDFTNGTVSSNDPVRGHGPAGNLIADRFHVVDKGNRLYFDGHVKVTLYPEDAK